MHGFKAATAGRRYFSWVGDTLQFLVFLLLLLNDDSGQVNGGDTASPLP